MDVPVFEYFVWNWSYCASITFISYLTLSLGLCICLYILFRPFNRYRNLTDLGYDDIKWNRAEFKNSIDKKSAINAIRARRKIGELPPAYPNGWFALLESDTLLRSAVKEVYILGQNLVAWRGESGKSYVADAYCPHLGAHLAMGGKVAGECIKCAFHGWSFQGADGKVVDVPYSNSTPEFVKIKMWTTVEMNGFIYLWYHADDFQPSWWPERIPEIESERWQYRGRAEYLVNCHSMEISENAADASHFNVVHSKSFLAGEEGSVRNRLNFVNDVFRATWSPSTTNKHVANMEIEHKMLVFNKLTLPGSNSKVSQIGPGTVMQEFETVIGRGILLQFNTPIRPLVQRILIRFYASPAIIMPCAKLYLTAYTTSLERDIRIWNRKTFLRKPILTKEDQSVLAFRRWYSQFYTKNSPTSYFSSITENLEF